MPWAIQKCLQTIEFKESRQRLGLVPIPESSKFGFLLPVGLCDAKKGNWWVAVPWLNRQFVICSLVGDFVAIPTWDGT